MRLVGANKRAGGVGRMGRAPGGLDWTQRERGRAAVPARGHAACSQRSAIAALGQREHASAGVATHSTAARRVSSTA